MAKCAGGCQPAPWSLCARHTARPTYGHPMESTESESKDRLFVTALARGLAVLAAFRGGEPPQIFDRVVLRHGPPADYLTQLFPQLQLPCAPLRGKLRELELTGQLDDETHAYFAAET